MDAHTVVYVADPTDWQKLLSKKQVTGLEDLRGTQPVSFAFMTLYSVTLIKPSNQMIRSNGFDSTAV